MIKRQIIRDFFKARIEVTDVRLAEIVDEAYPLCLLQTALKHQILETPGPTNGGRVWLSVAAMAHSYYFCETNSVYRGMRIYKKMEPMFSAASLIDGIERAYYLQMLEPSMVLSISYADILTLRGRFKEISDCIDYLSRQNAIATEHRIILLNEPSSVQVKRFEEENRIFTNVASKDIKAMHLGLTRQAYNLQLKNNRESN